MTNGWHNEPKRHREAYYKSKRNTVNKITTHFYTKPPIEHLIAYLKTMTLGVRDYRSKREFFIRTRNGNELVDKDISFMEAMDFLDKNTPLVREEFLPTYRVNRSPPLLWGDGIGTKDRTYIVQDTYYQNGEFVFVCTSMTQEGGYTYRFTEKQLNRWKRK